MRRLSVVLISALVAATFALPAQAQWKWRTKNGQIQYSDTPPPAGTPDQDVLQRPTGAQSRIAAPAASAASAAAAPAVPRVEPELEAKRKKAEQDEVAKRKAEEDKLSAARAENCTRAKNYLRSLDEGIRIARTNDKGEREIMDDKGRAEETRRTREVVATDCK